MVFAQFAGGDVTLNKENIDPNGSTDCFIETTHTSTTNLIMTVVVPISTAIRVYANYFYYSGLSRILMFTIRFSKKNHDAIFYKFKFYVYIQATIVLSILSV